MSLSVKDFEKQLEELKDFIRSSVTAFANDNEAAKEKRIAKAKTDKIYFAKTYFPHYCEAEFCDAHKDMLELADRYNEFTVIAGFRGLAKSTLISFIDEIHKTVFNLNKFTIFCCDTQETAASEFLIPIKAELEENVRLINDFGDSKTSNWTNTDFRTRKGKRFLALGPKMGAKGKRNKASRPDRIIVEDFENINSSKKKSIIKRRLKFLLKDLGKSVSFKKWQFIFLGNYFSKKTIIHHLLSSEECKHWNRRVYPALVERAGKIVSAWEDFFPTKELLREQSEDPITFRTERMQKPEDDEAIFKEEWIQYLNDDEIDFESLVNVSYHDPSALKGQEHDYKAILTLGTDLASGDFIVIHAWIRKSSKWKSINEHFAISKKFKTLADGVESVGYQATLREDYEKLEIELRQKLPLKMMNTRINKEVRVGRLSSLVERGKIKFRRNNSGDMNLLIEQLLDFPDGENDDGPDAVAGAVELAETYVTKTFKKVKSSIIEAD